MSFLLDTNIFNHVIEGKVSIDDLPIDFPIIVTCLQRDEIMKCPDPLKRSHMLGLLKTIVNVEVPLEIVLSEVSRPDQVRVESDAIYNKTLNELLKYGKRKNKANEHDSLIGEVAIKNQFILITNDCALGRVVKSLGGHVRALGRS